MERKYTKGPWAYINPDGFTVRHPQVYSDTGPVCNATWLGDGKIYELRANARLIAAAPDLLDALEECRFALEPYDDVKPRDWSTDRERLRRAHEAARAAIAKATGGQE